MTPMKVNLWRGHVSRGPHEQNNGRMWRSSRLFYSWHSSLTEGFSPFSVTLTIFHFLVLFYLKYIYIKKQYRNKITLWKINYSICSRNEPSSTLIGIYLESRDCEFNSQLSPKKNYNLCLNSISFFILVHVFYMIFIFISKTCNINFIPKRNIYKTNLWQHFKKFREWSVILKAKRPKQMFRDYMNN